MHLASYSNGMSVRNNHRAAIKITTTSDQIANHGPWRFTLPTPRGGVLVAVRVASRQGRALASLLPPLTGWLIDVFNNGLTIRNYQGH